MNSDGGHPADVRVPRPFKAAQSYGPADGDLFFGRDAEGAQLSGFLAEHTMAVITAPSGSGKTSLLHAKVMPLLERDGWLPVYSRPHDDPLTALRTALVEHLLPDPAVEADVVERLALQLPEYVVPTLAGAVEWHTACERAQRVSWRLFAPQAQDDLAVLPMMCRMLRGSLAVPDLIEHFEAMVADGPGLGLAPQTPLHRMVHLLRDADTARMWQAWRDQFAALGSFADVLAAFQVEWAPLRPGLTGVVLIIDQFEELFTQFDVAAAPACLGELRDAMSTIDIERGMLPAHAALSLRKEFFADLVPHLQPFGAIERLTCFVGGLSAEQARQALSEPAKMFGLTFAGPDETDRVGCLARVLALALEEGENFSASALSGDRDDAGGRFTPMVISLIGAHLWELLRRPDNAGIRMPLSWDDFSALVPQLDTVFSTFLDSALRRVDEDLHGRANRFDALEMLDRLVTSTGFRNILAEDDLVEQMPLPRSDARRLIDKADLDLKLIRRESRRGGAFVEIMHERLIPSVRRMLADMRRDEPLRASLAAAHATLQLLADEPDPTRDALPDYLRASLLAHLYRLHLSPLAAKNLLRSLLRCGPEITRRNGADLRALAEWEAALSYLFDKVRTSQPTEGDESLIFADRLDQAIDELAGRSPYPINANRLRLVLCSALADRTGDAGRRISRAFSRVASRELFYVT